MNNTKTTKRALLSSVIAMLVCITMLIGTTFAWFTDTASTAVNKIQAGNLKIELQYATAWDSNGNPTAWENAKDKTLQFRTADGRTENILWEPGCTYELPAIRIKNNGNLALKYEIAITGIKGDAKLNEAIKWTNGDIDLETGYSGTMIPDQHDNVTEPIVIKGHMLATAGNEYQGLSIDGIGITVFATQYTYESDSFGNTYDTNATYLNQDAQGNYLISNANELVYFAKSVNVDRATYAGKTVKLTADIDLAGKKWIPVGQTGGYSAAAYFQGTFDGQNHTIKNLAIPESSWEAGSNDGQHFATGFFGFIDAGGNSIKNVTFDKATVEGHHWVGVVAGYMSGKVENVVVKNSTVTSTYKNGEADGDKAGAIAGYLNRAESVITGCTVENCVVSGVRDCGGIVGYSVAGSTTSSNTVKDTTVYYSTDNDAQIGGEIMGKRSPGANSNNTATNVTVTKLVTVSTAAELSNALNATYNADTTIKLANNITLSGEWGDHQLNMGPSVKVTFDGNGKTISGLTSSTTQSIGGFLCNGLISRVYSTNHSTENLGTLTVKNLTVDRANLSATGANASSGVIAANVDFAHFVAENCKITNATVNSDSYAAGFIGYAQQYNYGETVTLKNCTVSDSTFNGNDATGALIAISYFNNNTITGATVTGNTINGGAGYSAAALVGTSVNGTTATGVTANSNTFAITDTRYLVNSDTYGYIYHFNNTYTVNGIAPN